MASLTPPMHEAEAAALGLDYEYRIFDLIELGRPATDVGALLAEAKRLGFAAMNITHPCKQLVLDIVDELDPDAEHLGAVNLVVFDARPSHRIQHRLDGLPRRADRRAAGGVVRPGRADRMRRRRRGDRLRAPLVRHGTARPVRRRRPTAREDLAERMRAHFPAQTVATVRAGRASRGDRAAPRASCTRRRWGCSTTRGSRSTSTCSAPGAWVSDVVYRPLETELIRQAAERGHPVLDGGRMAVGQAYASLQIITGTPPDRDRMERHFRALIGAEERSGAGGGSR